MLLGRTPALKGAARARRTLTLRNRQRLKPLDLKFLRQMLRAALQETWPDRDFDLTFYFVGAPEITHLNEAFLQHQGSTDVITFDYADKEGPPVLHGEIFVCVEQAIRQARQFRATWQSELVRYAVHGILHLLGYDDLNARLRREMKTAENRLVRHLVQSFDCRRLGKTAR